MSLGQCSCFLCQEFGESFLWGWNVSHNAVELLLGVLILVSLSCDSDADLAWNVSDSLGPDVSVEVSLNTHILGIHFFLGESFDVSNGAWSSLFELDTLKSLVQVKSVIAAGRLHLCLSHLTTNIY